MNKTLKALLCVATLVILPACKNTEEQIEVKKEAVEVVTKKSVTKEVIE